MLDFLSSERPELDVELCETEDGTPYLSVQLEGWGNIMVTPEVTMRDRFGVVLTDSEGFTVKVAKGVPAYSALFKIQSHA